MVPVHVEAAVAVAVRQARGEEHRQPPERRLSKRQQPLQHSRETIRQRRRHLPGPRGTTTRGSLFTLFRTRGM